MGDEAMGVGRSHALALRLKKKGTASALEEAERQTDAMRFRTRDYAREWLDDAEVSGADVSRVGAVVVEPESSDDSGATGYGLQHFRS
ncbi:MAG: hypothetical protein ABIO70_21055 [Pseudomonadota bacterium]